MLAKQLTAERKRSLVSVACTLKQQSELCRSSTGLSKPWPAYCMKADSLCQALLQEQSYLQDDAEAGLASSLIRLGLATLQPPAKKVQDHYGVVKDLAVLVRKLINNFKTHGATSATGEDGPSHLFSFVMKLSPAGVQGLYIDLGFRDAATVNVDDARYMILQQLHQARPCCTLTILLCSSQSPTRRTAQQPKSYLHASVVSLHWCGQSRVLSNLASSWSFCRASQQHSLA